MPATAEASLVGGLADWFAVTALFRQPLGLPIPHTAIVKRQKDRIARVLGNFVQNHFLRREVIAQYGGVTGAWLATQEPGDDPRSQQWMEAWKERAAANERWIITTAEWLEAPGDASLATRQSAERRAAQASARFHQIDGAPR